jgi:hypothetical protein
MVIASRGKEKRLSRQIKMGFGPIISLFKGLLRLQGKKEVPDSGSEVIQKVKEHFPFEVSAFEQLLLFRQGEKMEVKALVHTLLRQLEAIITSIDTMEFEK